MYAVARRENHRRPHSSPHVDIYEDESGLVLMADMPGVHKGSLEVTVENNVLKIHGRVEPLKPDDGALVYQELRDGDYQRSFILTDEFDVEQISADVSAGLLTIRVPKAPRLKARRIQVSGAD